MYGAGYRKIDAYSPFPLEELSEAIGFHKNGVALVGSMPGTSPNIELNHMAFEVGTLDEVFRAPGQPRLRIALHHGEVLGVSQAFSAQANTLEHAVDVFLKRVTAA